jgi:hypothetical protein
MGIMNIWTLLLIGAGAILAVGLLALLRGVLSAPAGFQDESGFHLADDTEVAETEPAVPLSLAQDADGHFGHAA